MSHNIHSYMYPSYRPFCFQPAEAGMHGVVCCGSSWVWASLRQRRAKRCFLQPGRLMVVLRSSTSTQEHFSSCPNVFSFAIAGSQRNLMVIPKLLCPAPSDFLGVMGSGPPVPRRRCKLRSAAGRRHTGQEPEQMRWGIWRWSSDTWQHFVPVRATYVLQAVPDLPYSHSLAKGLFFVQGGHTEIAQPSRSASTDTGSR